MKMSRIVTEYCCPEDDGDPLGRAIDAIARLVDDKVGAMLWPWSESNFCR